MTSTNPGSVFFEPTPPKTVEKPIEIPLEPLFYQDTIMSPIEYDIEKLDGQKIRSKYFLQAWFKDEFGAKNSLELGPKLKSDRGFAKAKIVNHPHLDHRSL